MVKWGSHFFRIARCIDNKPVNPNRERKSIGAEQTFSKDIASEAFILEKLHSIAAELEKRMIKNLKQGKRLSPLRLNIVTSLNTLEARR